MSEYLQIHPFTLIGFLVFGLLTALGNSLFIRQLGAKKQLETSPFVSILGFALFSFVPIFLARWQPLSRLSITIGQFMLFRRSASDAIGGYEAIRSHPVDDVSLGRRLSSHGFKWMLVDGTHHIHCRMYRDFDSAVVGFTKNLFAFFDNHILLYLIAWLWIGVLFLEPWVVILLGWLGISLDYFPTFGSPVFNGKRGQKRPKRVNERNRNCGSHNCDG